MYVFRCHSPWHMFIKKSSQQQFPAIIQRNLTVFHQGSSKITKRKPSWAYCCFVRVVSLAKCCNTKSQWKGVVMAVWHKKQLLFHFNKWRNRMPNKQDQLHHNNLNHWHLLCYLLQVAPSIFWFLQFPPWFFGPPNRQQQCPLLGTDKSRANQLSKPVQQVRLAVSFVILLSRGFWCCETSACLTWPKCSLEHLNELERMQERHFPSSYANHWTELQVVPWSIVVRWSWFTLLNWTLTKWSRFWSTWLVFTPLYKLFAKL